MITRRERFADAGRALSTRSLAERAAGAALLAGGAALFAHTLEFDRPTGLDRRVRRLARTEVGARAGRWMSPLYPLGLPGGYIALAVVASHLLRRNRRSGGPRIVASAWMGWLAHRAIKLGVRRQRPTRNGERIRTDSYPSGHTTGATALALTTAAVLRHEGVISTRRAVALAIGAPLVMGAYRVLADDHWATDVVGGWLLGAAVAVCCAPVANDGATAASRRGSPRRVHRARAPSVA